MSLRFKRRIRLFPGVYLNIGKTGISTTIGPQGANINFGKRGAYLNAGIPGTGLSWREKLSGSPTPNQPIAQPTNVNPETSGIPPVTQPLTITPALPVSSTSEIVTSEGLIGLSDQIFDMRMHREKIYAEFEKINTEIMTLNENIKILKNQFFPNKEKIEKSQEQISQLTNTIVVLNSSLSQYRSELVFDLDESIENQYKKVVSSFEDLMKCQNIWDITSDSEKNNPNEAKSNTGMIVERSLVQFNLKKIEDVFSKYDQLHLQNANGADLYFFPACILLKNHKNDLILVDLKDLKFEQQIQRFIESSETVPSDAEIVDYVWTESNKDGTPDLRYKDNIRQPIVNYASLVFLSESGLCETYYVSDVYAAQKFSREFTKYLGMLHGDKAVADAVPDPATLVPSDSEPPSCQKRPETPCKPENPAPPAELEIPIPQSDPEISDQPSEISQKYFDLLLESWNEIEKMTSILVKDKDLLSYLKKSTDNSEVGIEEIIRGCIIFDLAQVFKILLGDNGKEKLVQMSSLAFAGGDLIMGSDNFQEINYPTFVALHKRGAFNELAEIILKIGQAKPPFCVTLRGGENESVIETPEFSLPAILSESGNPMFEKYAVSLCRFATVLAKADAAISGKEETTLKIIYEKTHNPIHVLSKDTSQMTKVNGNQSLNEVLDELDSLVGLTSVKQEVTTLINFAKVQKERGKLGLKSPDISYHLVLTGAPGTGKTTVARIVSKIYNKLGILEKGQLVETDKSGMIAEYLGQTPVKVNRLIDSALDGVLFIDEAYALAQGCKEDYGDEAIATLLKRMEDDRERLVVMVAGYTEEMKGFINENSGLKSRFNKYIEFPDYTPEEMLEIFVRKCQALDYRLEDEARTKVFDLIKTAYENRDRSFGNGRYVRNVFEKSCERQANRVAGVSALTKVVLTTIVVGDIPES